MLARRPVAGFVGLVALIAGLVASAGVAGATFGGAGDTNGFVAFDGNCNSGNQQILDIAPSTVGSTPPSCSGYGQQTTVGTDANPFYSADTKTVFFASSRPDANNNTNWKIYSIPSNFGGVASDGATQLTSPGAGNDFAPTASADGTTLAFIRCDASSSNCHLATMNLVVPPVVTIETTDNPLTPVNNATTGEHDRPEFNPAPANGQQVLYECSVTIAGNQYGHICLHAVGHGVPDVDLTNQAETTNPWPHTDENPDFKYDGSAIVFDTSGDVAGPNVIYRMAFNGTTASGAARVWPSAAGQGHEIDPIFSPDGLQYVWAEYGSGTYLFDSGAHFSSPTRISPIGKNISSQPTWEGLPPNAVVPEAPWAVALPLTGAGLIGVAALSSRRRRRLIIAS